jgi:hypothetical protein
MQLWDSTFATTSFVGNYSVDPTELRRLRVKIPMTPLGSLCPRSTHESHETTLQTDPAGQAVGPWVPAPVGWVGWVHHLNGDP